MTEYISLIKGLTTEMDLKLDTRSGLEIHMEVIISISIIFSVCKSR